MTLPLNTILNNHYRIERVIGKGGFGITYYAKHTFLGSEYAIKELFISGKCERGSDGKSVSYEQLGADMFSQFRTRFINEARTLTQLNHPYVVRVMDVFEENNTAYIVMDYVQGQTLQHIVDTNGPMAYPLAVNYMAQLAEAVGHCHAHQILHRDIKPENVMITPENKVVLIDFGSARSFVHDEVQSHTTILTQGYAPYEQYTTTSKKGNYSDIYSIGAVFYFLLTGQKPMSATDRVVNQMPTPKSIIDSIPNVANATIMKAMEMKPEDRYQSVNAFMNALLGGDTEVVPENVVSAPPTPTNNRKKQNTTLWSIIGSIAGCILIVLLIILLLPKGPKSSEDSSVDSTTDTPIENTDNTSSDAEEPDSDNEEEFSTPDDSEASEAQDINYSTSATINRVWFDKNYTKDGQKGMLIHVNFDVSGAPNQQGQVDAYFYTESGEKIWDQNSNKKYTTAEGQVCVYRDYQTPHPASHERDFELFIPYSELHLGSGTPSGYFIIQVWGNGNKPLAESSKKHFN